MTDFMTNEEKKAWSKNTFISTTSLIAHTRELGSVVNGLFNDVLEIWPDYEPPNEKTIVQGYLGPKEGEATFALYQEAAKMYQSLNAFENKHLHKPDMWTGINQKDSKVEALLNDTSSSVLKLIDLINPNNPKPDIQKIQTEINKLNQLSKEIYPHSLELFDNVRRFMTFCTIAARLVLGIATRAVLGQSNEFSRGIEQGTNKLYEGLQQDNTKRNLRDSINATLKEAEKLTQPTTEQDTKKSDEESKISTHRPGD